MRLDLRVGQAGVAVDVERLIVAGFTGRDPQAVRRHIDELARDGIAAPSEVPAFYVVTVVLLTTSDEVDVEGERTSGEVEPVLFVTPGGTFVGVGSDHTDRTLEREDIHAAKAACPKIVSRDVVRIEEVADRWDDLVIRSRIGGEVYQEAPLAGLLHPDDVLAKIGEPLSDAVVFLGTVPLRTTGFVFRGAFEAELLDTDGSVIASCSYRVKRRTRA